jgi:hypothetical protein
VAQSLSIHKTSLFNGGKFTASMQMEEFLQTTFIGKTGAKEAI